MSRSGGGGAPYARVPHGTAFPANPQVGDHFCRDDLNGMEYIWRGSPISHWLSIPQRQHITGSNGTSSAGSTRPVSPAQLPEAVSGFIIDRIDFLSVVFTTNDGTNNWALAFQVANSADFSTSIATASTGTGPDGINVFAPHPVTVGTIYTATTAKALGLLWTKNASPGNLLVSALMSYRFVG